jgi:hypothetical protein
LVSIDRDYLRSIFVCGFNGASVEN